MSGNKRSEELMLQLVELFGEISSNSDVVIVEGPKDAKALRRLGKRPAILTMSYETLADFAERTAEQYKSVTILTDFDRKGKNLNRKLSFVLQKRGVAMRNEYRASFAALMQRLQIRCIESLDTVVDIPEDLLQRGLRGLEET